MNIKKNSGMKFLALVAALFIPIAAVAQPKPDASKKSAASGEKPAIVLVHGAFVDGSSWTEVVPLLQKEGYMVTAAQLPLTSFADDVAAAKRVIDSQKGTVVAVGHSYGGAVITEVASNNPKVKSLVYVAAYAPDIGESVNDLNAKYAKTPLADALMPDAGGFLFIDPAKFRDVFAKDMSEKMTKVLAATQKHISNANFAATIKDPAWKTLPNWYLVTGEDRAVNPELQRFMAKRMGARVTEVKSSHSAMLSKPKDVVKIIQEAAKEEPTRVGTK